MGTVEKNRTILGTLKEKAVWDQYMETLEEKFKGDIKMGQCWRH